MEEGSASGEKLRVLVVDDDRDTADSSVTVLNFLGHEAAAVYRAEKALELARLHPPHVIFLDIAMPGIDGYQLARDLKALPGMDDVLLICISGYGTESDKRLAYAAGCAYHFIKPADWGELADLLAMVKADVAGENTPSARVAQIKEALAEQACHVQESVRQLSEDIRELRKISDAKP
ncbi:MAG TPA: response regulator [Gemmataceae bacterium]|jgi:CheY-like chemotaxis protein|nr:response regulator [Gemmataceae bacterium]